MACARGWRWCLLGAALLVATAAGGAGAASPTQARSSPVLPSDARPVLGLRSDAAAYAAYAQYLRDVVLPAGWKLSLVQKWDAYGHRIKALAPVAASLGMPVSVLTNGEAADAVAAAKAAGAPRPTIRRLMPGDGPARLADVSDALRRGLGIEELLSPGNRADVEAAARAAGRPIPVHVFLHNHYDNEYGYYLNTSAQVSALVALLDPALVKVKGFMMHTGGETPAEARDAVAKFNAAVCPAAKALAARGGAPVLLSFMSSADVARLLPRGGRRIVPPAGLCQGAGIAWGARIGSLGYGSGAKDNEMLSNGTLPVMQWWAPVAALKAAPAADGRPARSLAVVNLAARYPAPSWWNDVPVFEGAVPDKGAGGKAATKPGASSIKKQHEAAKLKTGTTGRPAKREAAPGTDMRVLVGGRALRLTSLPTDGRSLLVDVTGAKGVQVGTPVCLLCNGRPISALSTELDADDIDTGLCLSGDEPVVDDEPVPNCRP